MRQVTNIDGIVKTFHSDEDFLKYVQAIYHENEDGQPNPSEIYWLPENIYNAVEYIVECCPDLELIENYSLTKLKKMRNTAFLYSELIQKYDALKEENKRLKEALEYMYECFEPNSNSFDKHKNDAINVAKQALNTPQ